MKRLNLFLWRATAAKAAMAGIAILALWLVVAPSAMARPDASPVWAAPASAGASRPLLILSYHDVRDDVATKGDADLYAVSSQNFAAHLDWLLAHGFHPVSLDQIVNSRRGGAPLPARPVLLTFDDGLRSVYSRVFPLLRAYGFPALVAVVTDWVDLPAGRTVDYGPRLYGREDFLTWAQLREMRASGLIEVASHTHDLHHGVVANPQGNQTPAAVTRVYDPASGRYESEAEYQRRVAADLERSAALIAEHTGKPPRALVWPYAAYSQISNALADGANMPITFDLDGARTVVTDDMHGLARLLLTGNPSVSELASTVHEDPARANTRMLQVDLDAVYDADPAQQERNLDALIERVQRVAPSHVLLQAFADPDGNGSASALYFPNRFMPMRADLFNRVAWQLHTRASVEVFAWLPVLGFELPDPVRREVLKIGSQERDGIYRLDFTRPEVASMVAGIYEDLAANSYISGLLFHDDAYLRDGELPALAPGDTAARTQALIDFTLRLRDAAQLRRPRLQTMRNLYARPVLQARSQDWFAQRLDLFNRAYDYTALMAMPWMEGSSRPEQWLDELVEVVRKHDARLEKTVFELQTVDWNTSSPIPDERLRALVRRLQAQGVHHVAWYPDDFIAGRPGLGAARASMSLRGFPYVRR